MHATYFETCTIDAAMLAVILGRSLTAEEQVEVEFTVDTDEPEVDLSSDGIEYDGKDVTACLTLKQRKAVEEEVFESHVAECHRLAVEARDLREFWLCERADAARKERC
jgi:hypothetical protein